GAAGGTDAGGCGGADPRMASRARPAREARVVPAHGRALRPLQVSNRAAHLDAVVGGEGGSEAAGARCAARGTGAIPPRVPTPVRDRLARGGARLEHLAADLVGASAAALGVPGRPRDGAGGRTRSVRRVRLARADSERGRPRHLVLVGPLALRDFGLAG